MFNTSSHQQNENKNTESYIGNTVKIEGHLKSEGDILISGEVRGSVTTKKNINVGEEAKINGSVSGFKLFISGTIIGNVKAQDSLEVNKSAKIIGDIETKSLSVAAGAIITGQIKMETGEPKVSRSVEIIENVIAEKKLKNK